MARRNRIESFRLDEGINLTPLLDVLFNLIFFFILATTIKEEKSFLRLTLPTARQPATPAEPRRTMTILITADQAIYLDGEATDAAGLEATLREVAPESIEGVVVRADAKAYHETLVKALEACSRAGQSKLKIEVAPGEGGPAPPTP